MERIWAGKILFIYILMRPPLVNGQTAKKMLMDGRDPKKRMLYRIVE
jgi:hypothetical protein